MLSSFNKKPHCIWCGTKTNFLINRLPLTIRDECRGDRAISRQALIKIARKKQERGMLTAYNNYRLKQEKAKEPGGQASNQTQGKGLNDPAAVLEFAHKLTEKINRIDTSNWTNEDREKVRPSSST